MNFTSTINALPNEILQYIFGFIALDRKHTAEFWISGRQVCKSWRDNVAKIYLDLFILTPGRCNIFCGRYDAVIMRIHKVLMLELFFDRLEGPNNKRCVFKEDPRSTGRPSRGASETFKRAYEKEKNRKWKLALDEYLGLEEGDAVRTGQFERPAHIISIYGNSLDSALPGLEYDIEERELSFAWEPMFTAFFSEQHEINQLSEGLESYSELADRFAAEQLKPYSGHLRVALMAKKLQEAAIAKEKVITKVRRQRIMRQYQKSFNPPLAGFGHDCLDWKDEPVYVGKIVAANGAGTGRDRTNAQPLQGIEDSSDFEAEDDDRVDNESDSYEDDAIEAGGADEHHDLSDVD